MGSGGKDGTLHGLISVRIWTDISADIYSTGVLENVRSYVACSASAQYS